MGGVWSATRAYPGLGLQTDKVAYAFADMPMPEDYPEYPEASQVRAYLSDYVAEHGLTNSIVLNTAVCSAAPLSEDSGWSIQVEGPFGTRTEEVDWLVLCHGMYSVPHIPELSGRDEFEQAGGVVLTPSTTGDGTTYRDRDLVVLGWGKSAADIATSATTSARSVTMVARSMSWKLPLRIGRFSWQRLVLTRTGEQILWTPRRDSLLVRAGLRVLNPLRSWALRRISRTIATQLDLHRRGLMPERELQNFSDVATRGFYDALDRGVIDLRTGCQVSRLMTIDDRPCVELSDGTTLPCDVLLAATGYDQDLTLLGSAVRERLLNDRGELCLYRHTFPAGVARLAFIGWHNSYHSPISAQTQAMWVAAALDGDFPLPTSSERDRYTSVYRLQHQNAERLGEPLFFHAGGSLPDIDVWVEQAGLRLPRGVWLRELVHPIDPGRYRDLLTQVERRYASRRGGGHADRVSSTP